MRFLVIEDYQLLAELIRKALTEQSYVVDVTQSGNEGEMLAAQRSYDGIILDVMLPDHEGIQLCRNLRQHKISTPILMLTALSSTESKVAGLNAGADDYLTKPFEFEELLARVRALLRRTQACESTVLRMQDLELDLVKRSVKRDGRSIKLTAKEFALLEYFIRNPNRVLTRTCLGERVWDAAFEDQSNVVEVYVSRVRRKVDNGFDKSLIHTIIGTGYMLGESAPSA